MAAKAIGRSTARRKIFDVVYRGKKKTKSLSEIVRLSGENEKTVYNGAKYLDKIGVIHQVKGDGEIAYQKDHQLDAYKKAILSIAGNKAKLEKFATSTNPRGSTTIRFEQAKLPRELVSTDRVTVDDIDSFSRVRKIGEPSAAAINMLEDIIKRGFQRIIGEPGSFKHWPGERNDVYTTRVRFQGRRIAAAFAFKGRGTRKKLTPRDMGDLGNQIQRLFMSDAELFIIQHIGQVDESIIDQMSSGAIAKSYQTRKKIYYGVIDGGDTLRLIAAYPQAFS